MGRAVRGRVAPGQLGAQGYIGQSKPLISLLGLRKSPPVKTGCTFLSTLSTLVHQHFTHDHLTDTLNSSAYISFVLGQFGGLNKPFLELVFMCGLPLCHLHEPVCDTLICKDRKHNTAYLLPCIFIFRWNS